MGYYVTRTVDIYIDATNVDACLEAINKLHTQDRKFAWVSNPRGGGFSSLKDALGAWRFEANTDDCGGVSIEYFTGEKLGHEEDLLYPAIAPFVKDGGGITSYGEDGEKWYHIFEEGSVQASYNADLSVHELHELQEEITALKQKVHELEAQNKHLRNKLQQDQFALASENVMFRDL